MQKECEYGTRENSKPANITVTKLKTVMSIKNKKAADWDGISPKIFLLLPENVLAVLTDAICPFLSG